MMSGIIKILIANKALVIVVLLVAGWFYWFQWRPSEIKKNCNSESLIQAQNNLTRIYQKTYDDCRANEYRTDCDPEIKSLNYQKSNSLYLPASYENYYATCLQRSGLK